MKKWVAIFLLGLGLRVVGHESRPGYLEMRETRPDTYEVVWKVPALGDRRLSIHLEFPEGTQVLAGPAASFSDNAYFERQRISRRGGLVGTSVTVNGLAATQTDALVRVIGLDGTTQTTRATPEHPRFAIEETPSSLRLAWTYTVIGGEHILLGMDHLLFVSALVLLVKSRRKLIGTITAFTGAHSLTLAAATLGWVHVPGPPVEACIALSIVFVAAEVLQRGTGRKGLTERWPWCVAFSFGLLHGLGFAGALSEVGLPPQAIPIALLFFNVGVELGQLAFIGAILLGIAFLRKIPLRWPSWGWRVAPYAIGCVAAFWVVERTVAFIP
ncbi:hydrogenase/urease accessory protein HupE [Haloferula luteola]|uniref:Hydrogenase/urease accessory protein HupE n=1 Tax=Haloferula luteola TaxID=595692 RepID=A0A840V5T0_9BACT|nr:HupE/UreJ family protein [Haloferula luteola]MBB5350984.1 hydrogenase/urease accessory protein HupE [Haloferula luteola]